MAVDEGFESWYLDEHPRLLASMVAISGNVSVATDATDEAFLRAFERWERVGQMISPGGWTYRTALNLLRRRFRRQALEARLLRRVAAANGSFQPPPDWSLETWEALRALPARERTAVVLRHVADLPTKEIAAAMGVVPGTVASSLHSGRTRLARQLTDPKEVRDG